MEAPANFEGAVHPTAVHARHCGAACQQEVHEFLVYECPMYERKDPRKRGMTAAQPNFVFSPEIRTEEHPFKWILRGVALLNYFDE